MDRLVPDDAKKNQKFEMVFESFYKNKKDIPCPVRKAATKTLRRRSGSGCRCRESVAAAAAAVTCVDVFCYFLKVKNSLNFSNLIFIINITNDRNMNTES